ncbi:MAG: hypothetical protein JO085_12890, partial [Acidimicrobiia bacterium]|nr:hypothetical protein [Acidimicrobiia bacterium]
MLGDAVHGDAALVQRCCRNDVWLDAGVTVSRLYGPSSLRFAVVIGLAATPERAETSAQRVNRLEAYLARIGAEVQAAGMIRSGFGSDLVDLTALSTRQTEIVYRLVDGQR